MHFLLFLRKNSFTSISKTSISLEGSSTRLPIGSSPLDPTGWLPSLRIPSPLRQSIPKVTEPLTPLAGPQPEYCASGRTDYTWGPGGGRQIILVLRCTGAAVSCGGTDHSWGQVAWRGSVVRASVFDWRTFPDMRLIYGWRVTTSRVRRPLRVNQPGQLNLLPSVGRGMSSISIVRWVSLLAAVSPSSEC